MIDRNNKLNIILGVICLVLVIVIAYITLFLGLYTEVHNPSMFSRISNIVDYLDKNETNKDVKIYTSYEDGGYLEWRGYKPYIDARGDVFIKGNNKKFELMDEYYKAIKNDEFNGFEFYEVEDNNV